MNKIKNSLSKKIISVVATVFVVITVISYITITSLLKDTLYNLEKDKANLIAKNYAPLISINLFLGMKEEICSLADIIMKNKSVLKVEIFDNDTLISSKANKNITDSIKVKVPIYKPNSQTKIGSLEIVYSTDNFNKLVYKYFTLLMYGLLIIVLIIFGLNIYIKKLLKPLKKLANLLKDYSPNQNIKIPYLNETNEIGLISNAMNISQKKCSEYSNNLQNLTKELQDHNTLLEYRVKEEVKIIKQKDEQLMHQSRLAQMGEMISMIAHQWRQPLSAINATSSNLQFSLIVDEIDKKEFENGVNAIIGYSKHLSDTIDDFRNFFKKNKTKEFTTLNQIVGSTLNIIQTSIENKNIDMELVLNCNQEFETYENEIKQVLLNLIKNAEDILLDREIKEPKIYIETICKNNNMILIVKDNAGGIPENIIYKIFDPYFSTKTKKDGTGLGLYMSKTIVESHCRGELTVSNDENGAVFIVKIPDI